MQAHQFGEFDHIVLFEAAAVVELSADLTYTTCRASRLIVQERRNEF